MHDDIMDQAPKRRGKATVHSRYDVNTAILSGDVMFVKSVELINRVPESMLPHTSKLFLTTAREVCEGQQMDMNFETRNDVSVEEYLEMIRLKTAVLLACAFKMGSMLAGASMKDQEHIYAFGESLGTAFQLRDDYLDSFGDPEKFGKKVGGDIIQNKKTWLLIKAFELAQDEQLQKLNYWIGESGKEEEKVNEVKQIFTDLGVGKELLRLSDAQYEGALMHLEAVEVSEERKAIIREFGDQLMARER
jgi:geranylgeranyl diphosphate synthase type II